MEYVGDPICTGECWWVLGALAAMWVAAVWVTIHRCHVAIKRDQQLWAEEDSGDE